MDRKPVESINQVWPNLYIGDEWVGKAPSGSLKCCLNNSTSVWMRVQICGSRLGHAVVSGRDSRAECCGGPTPHQHRSALLQQP